MLNGGTAVSGGHVMPSVSFWLIANLARARANVCFQPQRLPRRCAPRNDGTFLSRSWPIAAEQSPDWPIKSLRQ